MCRVRTKTDHYGNTNHLVSNSLVYVYNEQYLHILNNALRDVDEPPCNTFLMAKNHIRLQLLFNTVYIYYYCIMAGGDL